MDYKKEIEEVLNALKEAGFDRTTIEEDMGYSENYIDQTLSKGGNKKFLKAMVIYRKAMLQNTTPINGEKMLNSERDKLLEEKESRRKDFEHWADLSRRDKEKAENEKDRLLNIIENNLTKLLEVSLNISSNLTEVKQDTYLGLSYQRAWVEYTAEEAAQGDKKKKDQKVLHMNKLLRSQIDGGRKEGKSSGAHKQHREEQ